MRAISTALVAVRRAAVAVATLSALLACAAPAAVSIVDPGQGPVALPAGTPGAAQLSGLGWAGADVWYAVSDAVATLFELDVDVDASTGEILTAAVVDSQALGAGSDLEGLVLHPLGSSVLASDEVGPAIREYRLSDGAVLSSVTVPAIYANVRANRSLESLALRVAESSSDDALWTANEEALTVDGPVSTATTGTIVRLQRYDESFVPDGQWAYVTDPYPGAPFLGQERSGVADLLALPGGELLVLERSFSTALFRLRLYRVDFAGATDTTALGQLDSDPFTPAAKTLLWEISGGLDNFEGLALGPELDAGDRSLLLVSDDGGGLPQSLYALRLELPEPGAAVQLAAGLLVVGLLHRRR